MEKIRKLTNPSAWNHCPGRQYPTDLPSHGLSAKELLKSRLWWDGPSFIARAMINTPELGDDCTEEAEVELLRNPATFTQVLH